MAATPARVNVRLPPALRRDFSLRGAVEAEGDTLAEALADLNRRHPGLGGSVLDDQGKVRRNVIVFRNSEAVTHLDPEGVHLESGDTVHVLPHVAGG
jgi:molybdopterin converting factor small subunit